MQVSEVMTKAVRCCTPTTSLQEVAQLMVDCHCGEIPVTDEDDRVIGVITDRDIVCRTIARGNNPLNLTARDCMTDKVVTITPGRSIEDAIELMERNMIRRLPVVNQHHECLGMITQSDIARRAPTEEVAELVQSVSKPTAESSMIH